MSIRSITYITLSLSLILLLASCAATKTSKDVVQVKMQTWHQNTSVDSLPISSSLLDLFQDKELHMLVEEALQNNHDLKATALRLQASKLLLTNSRADLLPSANLNFRKGKSKQAIHEPGKKYGTVNSHQLSLNVAWEVDIWGKLYENHKASVLTWEASKQDYILAQDALISRLIESWCRLISSKKITKLEEEKYEASLKMNQSIVKRFESGLINLDEFNQSSADLQIAKLNLHTARENYYKNVRDLELLLGREPQTKISANVSLPEVKKAPATIPSVVLQNRPDIKAALARLNASYKQASVAKKQLLPSVNLSADMFKNSIELGDLSGSKLLWNVIGSLTQPVFNAGRLRNQAKASKLEAEANLETVKKVVYTALKEVENSMSLERTLETSEISLKKALHNYKSNQIYYEEKYRKGLVEFRYLLEAQQLAKEAEIRLINVKADRISNRIAMAMALGYSSNK